MANGHYECRWWNKDVFIKNAWRLMNTQNTEMNDNVIKNI